MKDKVINNTNYSLEEIRRIYERPTSLSKLGLIIEVRSGWKIKRLLIEAGATIRKRIKRVKPLDDKYLESFTDADVDFEEEIKTRIFK